MSQKKEDETALVAWNPRELKIGDSKAQSLVPTVADLAPKGEVLSDANIDMDDLVLPELKLCQSTTEEVQDGLAKPGQYVLTTTKEVYDPPLQVLIVFHSKGRALFPNEARGTGHLQLCLSNDSLEGTEYGLCEDCSYKEWPDERSKKDNPNMTSPPCTLQHNFVVMLPQGPAVVRFGRTSFKAAKKFLTTFKFSRDEVWANVAVLRTKRETVTLAAGKTTYYTHELVWDKQDAVPDSHRSLARDSFQLLRDLHEQAKLGLAGSADET